MLVGKTLARITGIGLLACVSAAPCLALDKDTPAEQTAARKLLADALAMDARERSRNTEISAPLAAREASALLQAANQLDPSDLTTLRLLVEAAAAAKQPEVLRSALRQTVKLDPGNFVAQVRYLDLLAQSSQTVEERAHIYQAAYDRDSFDPQVRSEMAVRLAKLSEERGEVQQARTLLKSAIQLNDVNVSAYQELARLTLADANASAVDRFNAVMDVLLANPYQPDAWLGGARQLAAANQHDRAAEWYVIVLEQMNLDGTPPVADLYFDFAMEMAIAGRRAEAEPIIRQLADQAEAPIPVLAAILALKEGVDSGATSATKPAQTQPAQSQPAQTQPKAATEPAPSQPAPTTAPATYGDRLRAKFAEALKARPKDRLLLAEVLTTELGVLPEVTPDIEVNLKALKAEMAGKDSMVLARIEGWMLYRQGKLQAARERLSAGATADPAARLALARIALAESQPDVARKTLQDLWAEHPTGVLALMIAKTAQRAGISLEETALSHQMGEAARRITSSTMYAHRQPKDLVLVSTSLPKRQMNVCEPIVLTVRQTNTSDRALSVGTNGAVKTTAALAGTTRGLGALNMGMFAIDDPQRIYRLERRATIQYDIRVDQGVLAQVFIANPIRTITVGTSLITGPRGTTQRYGAGLGGQVIAVGDFDRVGVQYRTVEQVNQTAGQLLTQPAERRLIDAYTLSVLVASLPEDQPPAEGEAPQVSMSALRTNIAASIVPLINESHPITLAWLMRMVPQISIAADMARLLDKAPPATQAGPAYTNIARIVWAWRRTREGIFVGSDTRAKATEAIKDELAQETDPLVKEWFSLQLEELKTVVSTAPTTNKAETQPAGTSAPKFVDPKVTAPTATPKKAN